MECFAARDGKVVLVTDELAGPNDLADLFGPTKPGFDPTTSQAHEAWQAMAW